METDKIWKERRDYIEALLYIKHNTVSKSALASEYGSQAVVHQPTQHPPAEIASEGIRQSLISKLKRHLRNERVKRNPIIRLLVKIKRALGIKFY